MLNSKPLLKQEAVTKINNMLMRLKYSKRYYIYVFLTKSS